MKYINIINKNTMRIPSMIFMILLGSIGITGHNKTSSKTYAKIYSKGKESKVFDCNNGDVYSPNYPYLELI